MEKGPVAFNAKQDYKYDFLVHGHQRALMLRGGPKRSHEKEKHKRQRKERGRKIRLNAKGLLKDPD